MYEVLLTRIFSATMWYHYAFVAVSVAMFGMTLGAVVVHLRPAWFAWAVVVQRMAQMTLLFALTMAGSFVVHLFIPFQTQITPAGLLSMAATYMVIAVPFVFSGIGICLALTHYSSQVGRLYAADLAGAALGCVAVVVLLQVIDGPSMVFACGALAAISAACFAAEAGGMRRALRASAVTTIVMLCLASINAVLLQQGKPLIRLWWVKGEWEAPAMEERWNSFSRIRVAKGIVVKPFGWGMGATLPEEDRVQQLYLNIDSNAGTCLTRFDGDLNKVRFLKYDVTNLVDYIRPGADVLVLGVGGGRDLLSALVFNQKRATGVEINDQIISLVTKTFGDFTGHLDRHPGVRLVNDEARSYIARSSERFDIIQMSLIDTWAATAAGAYVLSENSLYTTDAWDIFLSHLTDRGVFSVSRWYYSNRPNESWRVIALANASLRKMGVEHPEGHIMLIKAPLPDQKNTEMPDAVATILVSRQPFSAEDVAAIGAIATEMKFEVELSPETTDGPLHMLASAKDLAKATASMPLNLMPPTDDQPFFFNMARFGDMFSGDLYRDNAYKVGMTAVGVLGGLLIVVSVLATGLIVVPIALRSQLGMVVREMPLTIYFLAIGTSFMLVEISQMQRLVTLLGHPTYSLGVVLCTLLVASGLGSYTTSAVQPEGRSLMLRLGLLVAVLAGIGLVTPVLVHQYQGQTTPLRIALAVGLLAPAGLFMGMAFPMGMKMASRCRVDISAWLWAINGAASIVASVLAVVIALAWGINAAWWTGVAGYVVALVCAGCWRWTRAVVPVGGSAG